ncbi:MAG: hypothetical protein F6J97_17955 [Leptolyngbya sp. SIO4C1]|nr:hypothetical protein [Leptolyngbya sp. SIO4C1]
MAQLTIQPFPRRDPRNGLENAGLLFLHHACYLCAASCFGQLADSEPRYDMAWYGLANALHNLSSEKRDIEMLLLALACTRRALAENSHNSMALALETWIAQQTPLGAERFQTCQIYEENPAAIAPQLGFSSAELVKAWRGLNTWQARLQALTWLALQRSQTAGDLIKAAICDPAHDIQVLALKHISPWGNRLDVRCQIAQLAESEASLALEPYLSRAIHQISQTYPETHGWAMILQRKLASQR